MMSDRPGGAPAKQDVKQVEPVETEYIPAKPEGINIAGHMQAAKRAERDAALSSDDSSASIERFLGVIKSVESTMQEMRKRIETIKIRQELLAQEYKRLGTSLDAASFDLAQQFVRTTDDLGANVEDSNSLADGNKV
jgi:hypothetical protein